MTHPNSKPRPPEDFSRYLATREALLLVGGQAVNLWALLYKGAVEELAPFVSRDVDLLGDREVLKEIAELAGVKPNFFPLKPPSNEVGYVAPADGADTPLLIEVLRWVNGVSKDELMKDSVIMGVGPSQIPVRVPSPVYLLKAKLANLSSISQQGRQDAKHVRILCRVIPVYLDQLVNSLSEGGRSERDVVNILGVLLEVASNSQNLGILKELKIAPEGLFRGLSTEKHPKIASFKKHQLARAFSGG